MRSYKGHFLIASPHLADTNFFRSVVLMVQHDDEGAFGLVLNRPTNNAVADLWHMVSSEPCTNDSPVYLGGPVPGPLVAIHCDMELAELEILAGVYFASTKEVIERIVSQAKNPFRLFVGYSGWGPRQLDSEIEAGGWLIDSATSHDVFSSSEDLWNRVARRIGLDILAPSIRRGQIPDDPSMN